MVSLKLPTVFSVGKGGKHAVAAIWRCRMDLVEESFSIVTDFDRHYKSKFL